MTLQEKLNYAFNIARDNYYYGGHDSTLEHDILSAIDSHGLIVYEALLSWLWESDVHTTAEAIQISARIEDKDTESLRMMLAVGLLFTGSGVVAEGAGIALRYIDNPRSLQALRISIETSNGPRIERLRAIESLERTLEARVIRMSSTQQQKNTLVISLTKDNNEE